MIHARMIVAKQMEIVQKITPIIKKIPLVIAVQKTHKKKIVVTPTVKSHQIAVNPMNVNH